GGWLRVGGEGKAGGVAEAVRVGGDGLGPPDVAGTEIGRDTSAELPGPSFLALANIPSRGGGGGIISMVNVRALFRRCAVDLVPAHRGLPCREGKPIRI